MTALALAYAGYMNFVRHQVVIEAARTVRARESWIYPLGTVLSAGALGLLLGFVVPAIGAAAVIGVILYFSAAIAAHLRVGDHRVLPPPSFSCSLSPRWPLTWPTADWRERIGRPGARLAPWSRGTCLAHGIWPPPSVRLPAVVTSAVRAASDRKQHVRNEVLCRQLGRPKESP